MPSNATPIFFSPVNFLNYSSVYYRPKDNILRGYESKGAEYQPLVKEMTAAIIDNKASTLNFKDCNENTVAELNEKAQDIVSMIATSKVAEVCLPTGMTQIPEWLTTMPNIRSLKISAKPEQTHLDLTGLNSKTLKMVEIKVSGSELRTIKTQDGIHLRFADVCVSMEQKQKISVTYCKEGGEVRTATLPGKPYFARSHNTTMALKIRTDVHLNGVASFPKAKDGKEREIVCRHLSLFWLYQTKEVGGHLVDHIEQRLDTEDKLAHNVPPELEARYAEVLQQGKKNYLVSHSQWGAFLHKQFTDMGLVRTKKLVIHSGNHVMALLLKIKDDKQSSIPVFVAEFYDPNMTITHLRRVEGHIEKMKAVKFSEFIDERKQSLYFGKNDNPLRERVILLIELPENISASTMIDPLWNKESTDRKMTFFLNPEKDKFSPACVYYLMLNDLGQYLTSIIHNTKKSEIFDLLKAKNSEGVTGLSQALLKGNTKTVKAFIDAVTSCCAAKDLSSEQVVELLAARSSEGMPGLCFALFQGKMDAVKAFIDGVKILYADKVLSSEQVVELLAARDSAGTSGLFTALFQGKTDVVKAFIDGVKILYADKVLSSEQVVELLAAKSSAGIPGLCFALFKGNTDTVSAFIDGVKILYANKALSFEQVIELLAAKDSDGTPGVRHAQSNGKADTVNVFNEGVKSLRVAMP